MDRLLTAEQTAAHFQVHPKTINAWVKAGILAATDIGGVRRFKAADIAVTEQAGRKVVTAPEPEPKAPVQLVAAGGWNEVACRPVGMTMASWLALGLTRSEWEAQQAANAGTTRRRRRKERVS